MKLSQMTNDQATDFLVRVTSPIARIMDDEEIQPLLTNFSTMKDVPITKVISTFLPQFVTFAIKGHKDDLYEIIGAFSGKSKQSVGKMNLLETMNLMKDSIDKDFLDFFKSLKGQELVTASE